MIDVQFYFRMTIAEIKNEAPESNKESATNSSSRKNLMNFSKFCLSHLILSVIIFHPLLSQTSEQDIEEFYYVRPYLLITLATGTPNVENSIEREISDVIAASVSDLGCYKIIDRNSLAHLVEEDTLQSGKILGDSTLVMIGRLAYADELMIVEIVRFRQQAPQSTDNEKGKKADNDLIIAKSKTEKRPVSPQEDFLRHKKNVQTDLSIKIRILDIDTGQQLETVTIEVNQTGESHEESRANAIKELRKTTIYELKKIFLISPKVLQAKNTEVLLGTGSKVGIRRGMLFIIKSPDQLHDYFDQTFTIPGKPIGIVSVNKISEDSSSSTILRQNGYIESGYRAFEYPKSIYGLRIFFSPAIVDSMMNLGAQFFWNPIQKLTYGLGMSIIRVADSYGDNDFGLGIEGIGGIHLLSIPRVRMSAIIGLNLDLPFRKDDDNNSVFLPILSGQIGLMVDIIHYWKSDISIIAGYRISSRNNDWKISDEEEATGPVYWESKAPEVNISGFFIQVGYKFIFL